MNIFQAIIIGVVQGATEFLPVSSSGHLVIFSQILGELNEGSVFFFVLLHVATLLAVIIYFWQDLLKVRDKQLGLLILATIPAAIVSLFLRDLVEGLFVSVKLVGGAMLITGVLNLLSDWKLRQENMSELRKESQAELGSAKLPVQRDEKVSFFPNSRQSIIIGVAQAVAITPGISRSGSTVAIGLLQGVKKETAFRFSFLLSIPTILGALILELLDIWQKNSSISLGVPEMMGLLAAFITGLLSLKLLSLVLAKNQMKWFGIYALILGVVVLIFA